jgi:hypothetical protein
MDPMDPDFWRRQWEAFVSAPIASGVFLVVGALGAWWARGSVDQGEIRGLQAQIEALKQQINALEQRLKLAGEQEQAASKALQSAKEELATLKTQLERRFPDGAMAVTTATIEGHLLEAGRAQELVSGTLQAGDTTLGGLLGRPPGGSGRKPGLKPG